MPVWHTDGTLPTGPDWIYVFGSNLAGFHAGGAARAAVDRFGAVTGVAEGPTGRAYAIPTKDQMIRTLPLERVAEGVARFLDHAAATPDRRYFVTRVGCGLAGFRDQDIAPLFRPAPENCSFADAWRPFLR
ncbi:hypothetical protein GC169_07920 [bacterium]|nr:hypothetical protein [bacterium]